MTICIYHGNCADGFGAAWAVWKRFPDWEFVPGVYGEAPPDVTDRDVVLVDFSYKETVISQMAQTARSILILDHHKSALDDLGYVRSRLLDHSVDYTDLHELFQPGSVRALFDMDRSGAMIAWNFFHPGDPAPKLIEHLQDRDLWQFKLPYTREIQACVFSHPYDFDRWDYLVARAETEDGHAAMCGEGGAIERKHHKDVAELVKVCKRGMWIGGWWVPAASLPYTLTSDAGHLMCRQPLGELGDPMAGTEGDYPKFAACYWDTPEGRVFSLRSVGGFDVQEIAVLYGGGGHKNASGFQVPFERLNIDGSPRDA